MKRPCLEYRQVPRGSAFLIDGQLQFDSRDEAIYHEALVLPPLFLSLSRVKRPLSALVLGGGDGLALKRLLSCGRLSRATLVDYDKRVLALGRGKFSELNGEAFKDPRVAVYCRDARNYVKASRETFDLILADFTSPDNPAGCSLFTRSFFDALRARLPRTGLFALNAVSPERSPATFWSIYKTLLAAGLRPKPMRFAIPSFISAGYGEWGMFFASPRPIQDLELKALSFGSGNRWLNRKLFDSTLRFPMRGIRIGFPLSKVIVKPRDMPGLVNLWLQNEADASAFADFSRNAASEKALASASNLPGSLVFSARHKNPADRNRLVKELSKAGLKLDSVFPVLGGGGPKTNLIHIFKRTDRAAPEKLSRNGKTAFLFPSTLSLYPGMGRELKKAFPVVTENLKELDKILGCNLSSSMEGAKTLLFPKADSQRFPVHMELVAELSLAVARSLSRAGIRPDAVAGYSVGEFAAASFAGVIGLRECFLMIRALALGCQECCLASPGGLFVVCGLSRKELETVAAGVGKDGHLCRIVFFSDVMLQGAVGIRQGALPALKSRLADFPHKLKRLAVAGAFHTPLFTPLARRMEKLASGISFNRAEFPLYMNRNGLPETFPEKIKTKLSAALDHPVLWQKTIERMAADGIKNFIELSPVPMLTEFVCKLPAGVRIMRADSPENFSRILKNDAVR